MENPEGLAFQVQPKPAEATENLTVVETIYHRSTGEEPTQYDHHFFRALDATGEQPYVRKQEVGVEWKQLDFGWLKGLGVSMFIVRNNEGVSNALVATDDTKWTLSSKSIEIGVGNTEASSIRLVVLPNESFRATPQHGYNWFVRCLNGPAKFTLYAFPR